MDSESRSHYEVYIDDLGHAGEGVGHVDGRAVFVPGAVPGDTVLLDEQEIHPRYVRGRLASILKPSPHRVTPDCDKFGQCGGCQLQHLSYGAQLDWKRERVRQLLMRIGGLQQVSVLPVIPAERVSAYRNKAQFPVGEVGGQVVLGFYERGSHELVRAEQCLIQHPSIRRLARSVASLLNRLGIEPYNEQRKTGTVRHVLCRTSFHHDELLVTLVATKPRFAGQEALVEEIGRQVPEIVGITLNVNTGSGNRILGERNITLWGRDYLRETLQAGDMQLEFNISATSFFQVNPVQAERLFEVVIDYGKVDPTTRVLDAYCGTGAIGLFLARAGAERVWGIEEVKEAVVDARRNARINNVANASFHVGRVEVVAQRLIGEQGVPDLVVVDPPRAGLGRRFLEPAALWGVRRWVYVSCNPATLARDLRLLCDHGYRLVRVQPVDMFPHTAHVECVALLDRERGR